MDYVTFGKACRIDYEPMMVKVHGRRWKTPEEVYQAMIMGFEQEMRNVRGYELMSEGEAKALELTLLTAEHMLDIYASQAVVSAASCDNWYMFEKQWG